MGILGIRFLHKKYNLSEKLTILKNYLFYRTRVAILTYLDIGIAVDNSQNGTFKVNYYMNDTLYTIVVKKNRLRCITHILYDDVDIVAKLRSYMGPYGDFHGIPTTPKMIGFNKNLTVAYKNAEFVNYKIDEPIKTTNIK